MKRKQEEILVEEETDDKSEVEEQSMDTVSVLHQYLDKQKPVEESPEISILDKLKGYDNGRLEKIVAAPKLYNPEVVEKARELLARREAWEQIKDLPDEELLEMTMADKGLYNDDVVEAASMELYQRESVLLRQQFMALTPDTVAAIANGTAPAPEGIRLAAQVFLDKNFSL